MKVTVLLTTHNHERVIACAINSVLMQRAAFDYEIVIIEDGSTDKTHQIVAEYQKRHPEKIRLSPAEKHESSNTRILREMESCSSEYIAWLDGDDSWTSADKLQRQVDFLDSKPYCAICFHNVVAFPEDAAEKPYVFNNPSTQKAFSTVEDLFTKYNFIAGCSAMLRRDLVTDYPDWLYTWPWGRWPVYILYAEHGSIGFINEVMGAFRLSSPTLSNGHTAIENGRSVIQLFQEINEKLGYRYDKYIQPEIAKLEDVGLRANEQSQTKNEHHRSPMPSIESAISQQTSPVAEVSKERIKKAIARLEEFKVFDPEIYLALNPDLKAAGANPHEHALQMGLFETRNIFEADHLTRALGKSLQLNSDTVKGHDDSVALTPLRRGQIEPIGLYVNSAGDIFTREIAEALCTDLCSSGIAAVVLDECSSMKERPPTSIYIAPHEFFYLGKGREWIREDIFANSFMLNTGQLQTRSFSHALPCMFMSNGVIDVSFQIASLLSECVPSLHLTPSGAFAIKPTLTDDDRRHPIFLALPLEAQQEASIHSSLHKRSIDVAFFGWLSKARSEFFARTASLFSQFETCVYTPNQTRSQVSQAGDSALIRWARHVSGHSKITLNIHRDEYGYFEWHRMVTLGMAMKSVVVSEVCIPHPGFKPGVHYFEAGNKQIPELIDWLLNTEDGMAAAEEVRENAFALISQPSAAASVATRLLNFVSENSATHG